MKKVFLLFSLIFSVAAFAQKTDSTKRDSVYILRLTEQEYTFLMNKLDEAAKFEAQQKAVQDAAQWQDYFLKKTTLPNISNTHK